MTTIHSEACCSIPPVQANYTAEGTYIEARPAFDKIYVTGDKSESESALIIVYDIFGYSSQALQGADILAKSVGARVFIPDFLGDQIFSLEEYLIGGEKIKERIRTLSKGVGNPLETAARLVNYAEVLKGQGFKKIGAIGFCWGGKVVILGALKEGTPLDAISIVHPGGITIDDAKGLSIPLGVYYSKDEPRDVFDNIVSVLSEKPFSGKVDSKYYPNMIHGWAAARGDLEDPDNKSEYEDLYSRASRFFKNALA